MLVMIDSATPTVNKCGETNKTTYVSAACLKMGIDQILDICGAASRHAGTKHWKGSDALKWVEPASPSGELEDKTVL